MLSIRPASPSDLGPIMSVLAAAKGIMRASGNLHQWIDGYPSEEVILRDISLGAGFVVVDQAHSGAAPASAAPAVPGPSRIVGYFAFLPAPEPTYAAIYDGAWLDAAAPYHVVHRIGSTPDSHGVFNAILDWCFTHSPNIRIDTHRDNTIMRHCIERYGFTRCGIIFLADGSERLAYQKILP